MPCTHSYNRIRTQRKHDGWISMIVNSLLFARNGCKCGGGRGFVTLSTKLLQKDLGNIARTVSTLMWVQAYSHCLQRKAYAQTFDQHKLHIPYRTHQILRTSHIEKFHLVHILHNITQQYSIKHSMHYTQ